MFVYTKDKHTNWSDVLLSNDESTVQLEEQESTYLETNKPSLMMKLADALKEEGIKAQVVKKIKFQ